MPERHTLSIGSQWIRHLPDQGNRSRWSRPTIISDAPFPSRAAIFSSVGALQADPGGVSDAGAAYLYQVETNGSATYLTKVTAAAWEPLAINFGYSVSQSGNILAVGAHTADPGALLDAGAAYLFQVEANGSATHPPKVTAADGATAQDYFGICSPAGSFHIWPSGHTMPIPGGLSGRRGGLSFSIGSHRLGYLPDQE